MKSYDYHIECLVITPNDVFTQFFDSKWKPKEILEWMKNTYCIDDKDIIETRITYINQYKLYGNN